jgi:peptidoglycan pentaglycine glycine transferase (the first glycine)
MAKSNGRMEWNDMVAASSGRSFLQSWEWGEFQSALSRKVLRVKTDSAAAQAIRHPFIGKRSWLYIPGGPLTLSGASAIDWSSLVEEIQSTAVNSYPIFIKIEPPLLSHQQIMPDRKKWQAGIDVQPRSTLLIDLTKSEEELQNAMHQKTRYNIRIAQKHGVKVRISKAAEDIDVFLELACEVSQRTPFRYHPDAYYRTMHRMLTGSNMLTVAIAEQENIPIAAHLLISFAGTMTYAHGASSSLARNTQAPTLLQWRSIQYAKEIGLTTYDFYGVAPRQGGQQHPWAGITRFKSGFGGRRRDYIGALDYIVDPSWFRIYKFTRILKSRLRRKK